MLSSSVHSVRPPDSDIPHGSSTSPVSAPTLEGSAESWHDQGVLASSGPDDRFRGDRSGDPRFGRPPAVSVPATAGAPSGGGGRPARGRRLPGRPGERGRPGNGERPKRPGRGATSSAEPVVPVRRMLSIAIAGFSLMLAF